MDFIFFENDIFCKKFNINVNKIVWKKKLRFFQRFFKNIPRIFPKKRSQK